MGLFLFEKYRNHPVETEETEIEPILALLPPYVAQASFIFALIAFIIILATAVRKAVTSGRKPPQSVKTSIKDVDGQDAQHCIHGGANSIYRNPNGVSGTASPVDPTGASPSVVPEDPLSLARRSATSSVATDEEVRPDTVMTSNYIFLIQETPGNTLDEDTANLMVAKMGTSAFATRQDSAHAHTGSMAASEGWGSAMSDAGGNSSNTTEGLSMSGSQLELHSASGGSPHSSWDAVQPFQDLPGDTPVDDPDAAVPAAGVPAEGKGKLHGVRSKPLRALRGMLLAARAAKRMMRKARVVEDEKDGKRHLLLDDDDPDSRTPRAENLPASPRRAVPASAGMALGNGTGSVSASGGGSISTRVSTVNAVPAASRFPASPKEMAAPDLETPQQQQQQCSGKASMVQQQAEVRIAAAAAAMAAAQHTRSPASETAQLLSEALDAAQQQQQPSSLLLLEEETDMALLPLLHTAAQHMATTPAAAVPDAATVVPTEREHCYSSSSSSSALLEGGRKLEADGRMLVPEFVPVAEAASFPEVASSRDSSLPGPQLATVGAADLLGPPCADGSGGLATDYYGDNVRTAPSVDSTSSLSIKQSNRVALPADAPPAAEADDADLLPPPAMVAEELGRSPTSGLALDDSPLLHAAGWELAVPTGAMMAATAPEVEVEVVEEVAVEEEEVVQLGRQEQTLGGSDVLELPPLGSEGVADPFTAPAGDSMVPAAPIITATDAANGNSSSSMPCWPVEVISVQQEEEQEPWGPDSYKPVDSSALPLPAARDAILPALDNVTSIGPCSSSAPAGPTALTVHAEGASALPLSEAAVEIIASPPAMKGSNAIGGTFGIVDVTATVAGVVPEEGGGGDRLWQQQEQQVYVVEQQQQQQQQQEGWKVDGSEDAAVAAAAVAAADVGAEESAVVESAVVKSAVGALVDETITPMAAAAGMDSNGDEEERQPMPFAHGKAAGAIAGAAAAGGIAAESTPAPSPSPSLLDVGYYPNNPFAWNSPEERAAAISPSPSPEHPAALRSSPLQPDEEAGGIMLADGMPPAAISMAAGNDTDLLTLLPEHSVRGGEDDGAALLMADAGTMSEEPQGLLLHDTAVAVYAAHNGSTGGGGSSSSRNRFADPAGPCQRTMSASDLVQDQRQEQQEEMGIGGWQRQQQQEGMVASDSLPTFSFGNNFAPGSAGEGKGEGGVQHIPVAGQAAEVEGAAATARGRKEEGVVAPMLVALQRPDGPSKVLPGLHATATMPVDVAKADSADSSVPSDNGFASRETVETAGLPGVLPAEVAVDADVSTGLLPPLEGNPAPEPRALTAAAADDDKPTIELPPTTESALMAEASFATKSAPAAIGISQDWTAPPSTAADPRASPQLQAAAAADVGSARVASSPRETFMRQWKRMTARGASFGAGGMVEGSQESPLLPGPCPEPAPTRVVSAAEMERPSTASSAASSVGLTTRVQESETITASVQMLAPASSASATAAAASVKVQRSPSRPGPATPSTTPRQYSAGPLAAQAAVAASVLFGRQQQQQQQQQQPTKAAAIAAANAGKGAATAVAMAATSKVQHQQQPAAAAVAIVGKPNSIGTPEAAAPTMATATATASVAATSALPSGAKQQPLSASAVANASVGVRAAGLPRRPSLIKLLDSGGGADAFSQEEGDGSGAEVGTVKPKLSGRVGRLRHMFEQPSTKVAATAERVPQRRQPARLGVVPNTKAPAAVAPKEDSSTPLPSQEGTAAVASASTNAAQRVLRKGEYQSRIIDTLRSSSLIKSRIQAFEPTATTAAPAGGRAIQPPPLHHKKRRSEQQQQEEGEEEDGLVATPTKARRRYGGTSVIISASGR